MLAQVCKTRDIRIPVLPIHAFTVGSEPSTQEVNHPGMQDLLDAGHSFPQFDVLVATDRNETNRVARSGLCTEAGTCAARLSSGARRSWSASFGGTAVSSSRCSAVSLLTLEALAFRREQFASRSGERSP